jgi:hypothetical protein
MNFNCATILKSASYVKCLFFIPFLGMDWRQDKAFNGDNLQRILEQRMLCNDGNKKLGTTKQQCSFAGK